jgi:hypothetical protein
MKPLLHYGILAGSESRRVHRKCVAYCETIAYIQNQAEHHRLKSFQEEYVNFLQKHGIRFEERALVDSPSVMLRAS